MLWRLHIDEGSPYDVLVRAAQLALSLAEQDDVHNGSVFHPGAVVFPPALAIAQSIGPLPRQHLQHAVERLGQAFDDANRERAAA